MRLVFYNPQINLHYGTTLYYFLTRTRSYHRYTYLLNFAYSKQGKMYVYSDKEMKTFSFLPFVLEIYIWSLLNNINPFNVKIIKINDFRKTDVLLCYAYGDLVDPRESLSLIKNKKMLKIMHTTHFFIKTSTLAKNYKNLKFDFIIGENNLIKNSPYFKKYLKFYKKDVYVLPFVFQKRFKKYKNFKERINKSVVTGTYQNLMTSHVIEDYKDFFNFFNLDTLHPMRKEIYLKNNSLKTIIDSSIGKRFDKLPKVKSIKDSQMNKILKSIYNIIFAKQKKYFSFDIVEKYNSYKMFVVPEEVSGLPSIGFVEGMACGAAYIGRKDPMYEDLGLRAGKHYIGYNGTLVDLKKKIKYYQKHPNQLEKIAEAGYKFVTENFNGEKVAQIFWDDLERSVNSKNKKIKSSFVK